ncbi:hypothetical protein OH802_05000 [Nocardioides sp. NBC_00850]|uniref:hypothetical protein n=1 Tax=Nocardioides sp. NBC_00850 TaxID=2976001 RepID=UPI00386B13E5|nr:hypothetical protein OH802_05000 [Nocardioides sp. NBC_00850]
MRSIHVATSVVAIFLLSSCGAPTDVAAKASETPSPSTTAAETPSPKPTPTPSPEDTLKTFDTEYFTIIFPDIEPEKEVAKHDNMTQTTYTIDLDSGDRLGITVLDLNPGIPFDLTQGLTGGAKALGGEVAASRTATVDGWPAVRGRFPIKYETNTGTGWATVIDKNQDVVFALAYEGWSVPDAKVAPELYERALASIKVK